MILTRLSLEEFRSYRRATLEPANGTTILHGANGQGKTNLLEAVHFLSTTRGFRSGRDADLVRWGQECCAVEGSVAWRGREAEIRLSFRPGARKLAWLEGASLPRPGEMIGKLHTVDFSSRDFSIIRGEPARRREFLDLELAQLSGAYAVHLARYKRALAQRNRLLSAIAEGLAPFEELDPWEGHLLENGRPLVAARGELVAAIAPRAAALHKALSGGTEELRLTYRPDSEAECLEEGLREARKGDMARASTGRGPHRDDIAILIAGESAGRFASQGQQRSAGLALKLAQAQVAEERLGEPPVILLEDVLSDLDEGRRWRLLELFSGEAQMIMTCTELEQLPKATLNGAKLVAVNASTLTEAWAS
jgi:DNA replication and repair protein RecF